MNSEELPDSRASCSEIQAFPSQTSWHREKKVVYSGLMSSERERVWHLRMLTWNYFLVEETSKDRKSCAFLYLSTSRTSTSEARKESNHVNTSINHVKITRRKRAQLVFGAMF